MDREKLGKPFLASFCWSEDKPTTNFVWCIIYIPYAAGIGEWAHLEASLQINVLHWLPAAIKRGPMDGEAYWWIWHRCTMHSRGVRGLTMKTFRMKSARQRNRASAAKGVGSFIAWAALSIITGPETGLEGGGSPSPSIGYWLCTGMITRSSKRTSRGERERVRGVCIKKKIDRQPRRVILQPKLISPLPFTWWNHNPYTPRGSLEISH